MLKSNPQCGGIQSLGLWELTGYVGGALMNEISAL